jgi:hypothetical protein
MGTLKWRKSHDSWKVEEAFATRGTGGGRYQIEAIWEHGRARSCIVRLDWGVYETRGTTETVVEAIAMAQAHNDRRLAAAKGSA